MKRLYDIIDIIISIVVISLFVVFYREFHNSAQNNQRSKIHFRIHNNRDEAIVNTKYFESQYSKIFLSSNESSLNLLKKLVGNVYVKRANFIKNIIGNIIVDISLKIPIARIRTESNCWMYMERDGTLFPSSNYNAYRLLILEIPEKKFLNIKNIVKIQYGGELLNLVNVLLRDKFLSRAVDVIKLNNQGRVSISTQFSAAIFEFGSIENFEEKMKKMELFYSRIVPFKGLDNYRRVYLEFKNQIICE